MRRETDDEFLARLRPPFIRRADRERLAAMMADAAEERGDHEAAERLRSGRKKGGSDAEEESIL